MYIPQYILENGEHLETVPQTCLAILPTGSFWDWFYEKVIVEALERTSLEVECTRAPDIYAPDASPHDIIDIIHRNEFVIADLTGTHAQVMFLFGQSLIFREEALILTQNQWDLPFDYKEMPNLVYTLSPEGISNLRRELAERFATVLEMDTPMLEDISSLPEDNLGPIHEEVPVKVRDFDDSPLGGRNERDYGYAAQDSGQQDTQDDGQGTMLISSGGSWADEEPEPSMFDAQVPTAADPGQQNAALPLGLGMNADSEPPHETTFNFSASEASGGASACIKKGHEYKTLGMQDEALAQFQKALENQPDNIEALAAIGDLLDEMGDMDGAVEAYMKTLDKDPNHYQALCGLGLAYARKGMHYEAINAYADAIRVNPNDASVLSNLGASYNSLKMVDDALEAYEQALRINPNSPKIHLNLGNAYFNKKMYAEAIQSYESALAIDERYEKARRNLERALKKQQAQ